MIKSKSVARLVDASRRMLEMSRCFVTGDVAPRVDRLGDECDCKACVEARELLAAVLEAEAELARD